MNLLTKLIDRLNTPVWDLKDIKPLEQRDIPPYDPMPLNRKLDQWQENIDRFMTSKPTITLLGIYTFELPEIQVYFVISFWTSVVFLLRWLM